MYMQRGTRWLFLAVVALLTVVPTVSQAAEPEFYSYRGEDAGTYEVKVMSEICGFPVLVFNQGSAKGRITYDTQGNVVRIVETYSQHYRSTYTNATTGTSLTTGAPAKFQFDFYPDGTFTFSTFGLQANITVRGQGSIFRDVGKLVIRITGPAEGEFEIAFEAGVHDAFYVSVLGQPDRAEQLCAALAG